MSKLTELRRRTDQDLLILLDNELERALTLARVAATPDSPFYQQAQTICKKVERLLPRLTAAADRQALRPKLAELHAALAVTDPRMETNPAGANCAQVLTAGSVNS